MYIRACCAYCSKLNTYSYIENNMFCRIDVVCTCSYIELVDIIGYIQIII